MQAMSYVLPQAQAMTRLPEGLLDQRIDMPLEVDQFSELKPRTEKGGDLALVGRYNLSASTITKLEGDKIGELPVLILDEPLSVLGRDNGPASLRYHVGLLKVYRDAFERNNVPDPLGYGDVGLGRAVFSVSSFMDVLRPAAERANGGETV
jgi:hypothetical protein